MEKEINEALIYIPGVASEPCKLGIKALISTDEFARLQKIIESKQVLFDHALQSEHVFVERSDDRIFLCGPSATSLIEYRETCVRLLELLVQMAQKLTRVNSRECHPENEKYAFRCFLLRLGMIGPEYKLDRMCLLSRLSGSAAFKYGAPRSEIRPSEI